LSKMNRGDPGPYAYKAAVTTTVGGIDQDTFSLTQSSPGFSTPASLFPKLPQTLPKDLGRSHHRILAHRGSDGGNVCGPVYGDIAFANAGIGERVVFQPHWYSPIRLEITDLGTNPALPLAIYWSLAHNRFYLKSIDNNTISSVSPVASIPVQSRPPA